MLKRTDQRPSTDHQRSRGVAGSGLCRICGLAVEECRLARGATALAAARRFSARAVILMHLFELADQPQETLMAGFDPA